MVGTEKIHAKLMNGWLNFSGAGERGGEFSNHIPTGSRTIWGGGRQLIHACSLPPLGSHTALTLVLVWHCVGDAVLSRGTHVPKVLCCHCSQTQRATSCHSSFVHADHYAWDAPPSLIPHCGVPAFGVLKLESEITSLQQVWLTRVKLKHSSSLPHQTITSL